MGKGFAVVAGELKSLAEQSQEAVKKISKASQDQAEAVNQINQGMEQISGVIQNNSEAPDETATSSEILAGLADVLKKLAERFQF